MDSEQNGGVQLLRVPSAVRELLPSKPYQAPEVNPLPGAETEPDCCSICLVELEAGEQVTVLPCMHFYHKVSVFCRVFRSLSMCVGAHAIPQGLAALLRTGA